MLRLAERQQEFTAALLDPERPAPFGLVGPDGEPSARRFAVYRNNVVAGLVETLQATFPAICRIVGQAFFQAMARTYVVAEPPGAQARSTNALQAVLAGLKPLRLLERVRRTDVHAVLPLSAVTWRNRRFRSAFLSLFPKCLFDVATYTWLPSIADGRVSP